MDTVGFVGLGRMGTPMAHNVADVGFDLRAYNRTRERAEPFAEAGHEVCTSPRAVAEGADAVVTMVTDDDALDAVVGGEDGLLAGLQDGAVLVQASTVSPAATERMAIAARDAGGQFVDAPVSGTVPPAHEGALTVLAGADEAVLERVRPVLSAFGDPVLHVGGVGAGTDAKLATNILLGNVMQGFAEALVFAAARDVDAGRFLEIIEAGGLVAPLYGAKGAKIRTGDFEPQFTLDLLGKDLSLALSAAADECVPVPATAATREAVTAARGLGHGEEDMAALVRFLEEASGVEVREE